MHMKNIIVATMMFAALSAFADKVVDVRAEATDGFGGDLSSVLTRCQTKAGGEYDPVTLSRDVVALRESKEFDSISADVGRAEGGIAVVFRVVRKMRFQGPLTVKGATVLSEGKVRRESGLRDGELYGEGDLDEAAGKVRAAYRKKHYPDVKVTPVPEVTSGNNCSITFLIDEGEKVRIGGYVFEGAGEDADIGEIEKSIGVYPWWNPAGWVSSAEPPVSRRQISESVPKIEEYFRNLGYLDVKVAEPGRVDGDKPGVKKIVYSIERGPLYRVAKTSITGLTRYTEEDVRRNCELLEEGSVASWKELTDAARRVEVAVGSGDSGLADTHVAVQYMVSESDPSALDIVFKVEEGVPVVINQVEIQGNDYTQDKVIRREIVLAPGDRMLEDRAEKSKRRLENLDYFSRVRYYLRKTGLGKDANGCEWRDLVYEVEEHNTGNFMVGVGASSVDSVFVSAEIQQSNFDLFAPSRYFRGGGQKARIYAQVGPRIQTYEAEVTEPWLFGRQLELSVCGYRRLRWYDDYDIIRSGAAATLSYPVKFLPSLPTFGRFGVRLSGEFIQFDDVERGEWEYRGRTVSLKEEDRRYGDAFEPVVRVFWSHDTRDTYRFTKSGSRTHIYGDVAPAGDNKYYRVGFDHRSYFRPWKPLVRGDSWARDHVFMAGVRAETIDGISDDVPIYNRMFLGGPKSIRGIKYRNVSTYARRAENEKRWDPWGGQTLFCANFEYTVPIFKLLRVAAFSDVGSVGADEFDLSDDFAWTAGIGFRIDIPMFPLRLDFGTPIEKPEHAKKEVFSFTVGYDF